MFAEIFQYFNNEENKNTIQNTLCNYQKSRFYIYGNCTVRNIVLDYKIQYSNRGYQSCDQLSIYRCFFFNIGQQLVVFSICLFATYFVLYFIFLAAFQCV